MDTIDQMRNALVKSGKGGDEPEMDFDDSALKVDDPLPGQGFTCISFINPEDVIVRKDQWKFYKYHQNVIHTYREIFTTLVDKVMENEEINHSHIADLQERMERVFNANESEYPQWSELVKDYEFKNGERDDAEFDSQNNYQTSIRGVKIRGTFATLKEAKVRAATLQKMDPRFHIFVIPVGYWCPSNPDPNKLSLKDQEYANNELNTLMKAYHENEVKKDMFYEEQTRQRIKEEQEQTAHIKAEQAKEQATLNNNVTDVANSTMNSDDLWLKRKQEQ